MVEGGVKHSFRAIPAGEVALPQSFCGHQYSAVTGDRVMQGAVPRGK